MKKIIIGFSRPKTWKIFAEAIMWLDKSDASHGYIRFHSNSWNTDFIYQSSHQQTNFVGGIYFKDKNIIVEEFVIEVPDEVEAKVGALCVNREGKPYGIMQCIGIALVAIASMFGKTIKKNPFANGDEQTICIEEVAMILHEGLGINSPLDMDLSSVKPFREWIRSLPQTKEL